MKVNLKKTSKKGFTLVESLVSIAIFIMLAGIVYETGSALMRENRIYRENTTISSLADQYMEIAKNLPYSQVGTTNGEPAGSLPSQNSPILTSINGNSYQMYYVVSLADGYKQVKFYVKNTATGFSANFLTNIAPETATI